jgi:hypothetical protein
MIRGYRYAILGLFRGRRGIKRRIAFHVLEALAIQPQKITGFATTGKQISYPFFVRPYRTTHRETHGSPIISATTTVAPSASAGCRYRRQYLDGCESITDAGSALARAPESYQQSLRFGVCTYVRLPPVGGDIVGRGW